MSEQSKSTPEPTSRRPLRLGLSTPGLRRTTEDDTKATPRAALSQPLKSNSSGFRRLGLGRPRQELTQKRLKFTATEEKIPPDLPKDDKTTSKNSRIVELEADIDIWRRGFKASMDDLQALIEPRHSKSTLLTQLGIPLEMLKYLDED